VALRRPVNRETLSARSSHACEISRSRVLPILVFFTHVPACRFSSKGLVMRGGVAAVRLGCNKGERGSSDIEVACVAGVLSEF